MPIRILTSNNRIIIKENFANRAKAKGNSIISGRCWAYKRGPRMFIWAPEVAQIAGILTDHKRIEKEQLAWPIKKLTRSTKLKL